MNRSVCFVIMPFGKKFDAAGREIDFDRVYSAIIAPAIDYPRFRRRARRRGDECRAYPLGHVSSG